MIEVITNISSKHDWYAPDTLSTPRNRCSWKLLRQSQVIGPAGKNIWESYKSIPQMKNYLKLPRLLKSLPNIEEVKTRELMTEWIEDGVNCSLLGPVRPSSFQHQTLMYNFVLRVTCSNLSRKNKNFFYFLFSFRHLSGNFLGKSGPKLQSMCPLEHLQFSLEFEWNKIDWCCQN